MSTSEQPNTGGEVLTEDAAREQVLCLLIEGQMAKGPYFDIIDGFDDGTVSAVDTLDALMAIADYSAPAARQEGA